MIKLIILLFSISLFSYDNKQEWCCVSGFSIKENYETSVISKLSNGTYRKYISFGFLLIDDENYGIDKNYIKVLDYNTKKYIDAKNTFFVLSQKGDLFSNIAKFAFSKKEDALKFIETEGGKIADFSEVYRLSLQNLKKDKRLFDLMVQKRYVPIGKKIYEKKCKKIDTEDFFEINDLKEYVKTSNVCGNINEFNLQSLSLFLWDKTKKENLFIEVLKKAKCPVCGMFVAKYPKWIAQISYKDGKKEHKLSFDGVKDMMKFYFNPSKWGKYEFAKKENIINILVSDYYYQKAVNAFEAFYVLGSNIYGPMGNELIAFESKEDAESFKRDHAGQMILKFDEIKEKLVYGLDGNE